MAFAVSGTPHAHSSRQAHTSKPTNALPRVCMLIMTLPRSSQRSLPPQIARRLRPSPNKSKGTLTASRSEISFSIVKCGPCRLKVGCWACRCAWRMMGIGNLLQWSHAHTDYFPRRTPSRLNTWCCLLDQDGQTLTHVRTYQAMHCTLAHFEGTQTCMQPGPRRG